LEILILVIASRLLASGIVWTFEHESLVVLESCKVQMVALKKVRLRRLENIAISATIQILGIAI
jgi:hypothetical protein